MSSRSVGKWEIAIYEPFKARGLALLGNFSGVDGRHAPYPFDAVTRRFKGLSAFVAAAATRSSRSWKTSISLE